MYKITRSYGIQNLRETPKFRKKSLQSGLICLNHLLQKVIQNKIKSYVAKDEFYRI